MFTIADALSVHSNRGAKGAATAERKIMVTNSLPSCYRTAVPLLLVPPGLSKALLHAYRAVHRDIRVCKIAYAHAPLELGAALDG
ncbi:unnamed protein product [Lasius platythorax]|uniref:Uncharacterized protein n=1 Tax=Lasius platythorax TaxID=488582 RepID=A0AAV2NMU5_9HYME